MKFFQYTTFFLLTLVFFGCHNDEKKPNPKQPFSLKIVHINDHHSHLESDGITLNIGGEEVEVLYGGMPRITQKIKELEAQTANILKLHAGDAITGDLYYTLFEGEADAAMMNQICFDAFTLGNHEFDGGDAGLVKFLDFLNEGDCQTPVLGANVKPEVGVSPLAMDSAEDYILPYVIKEIDGEKVAIIGIDIAKKTKNSSNPDKTTEFLDELSTAQSVIDGLESDVNKVIVMTHYQYENDKLLAAQLRGVDIIVGGDSHSLLGSAFSDKIVDLNPVGEYPTILNNADGDQVCVVQAWEYAKILGELDVVFDDQGRVTSCSGTPHLLLDNTAVKEVEKDGEIELLTVELDQIETYLVVIAEHPYLSFAEEDLAARELLNGFNEQTQVLEQTVIATIPLDLCYERVPGQGRSTICDVSQSANQGGDVPQLVAHAFRETLKTEEGAKPDIALQNAGGVRIDLPAGDFTLGDANRLLPFKNTMVILSLSGTEVKQSIEEGIEVGSGAYPYAAGLRFDVDANQTMGNRTSHLQVQSIEDGSWSDIDMSATYTVLTNSFAANGGDGYATFGMASEQGRAFDTLSEYAETFIDYAKKAGQLEKIDSSSYSTQSYKPLMDVIR